MGLPGIGLEALFKIDEFRKGMSEYMEKVGIAERQTTESASGLNKALTAISNVGATALITAAAGIAAGVATITGAAIAGTRSLMDWSEVVDGVGDVLGTNARESSALAVAIQGVGGNVGALSGQMATLTRGLYDAKGELGPTGKALQQLGIKFQDTNGNMLSSTQILSNVADVLGPMPDSLQKTQIMMALFGESGKELGDVLGALANGGLAEADAKARALGLSLSDETAAAAIKLNQEFANLKMAGQGLLVTFGSALLPGVLKAAEGLNKFVMIVVQACQEGGALYPVIRALGAVMSIVGDAISGGAEAAANGFVRFVSSAGGILGGFAGDAFTWGGNIISQLASGIIQGASSFLAGAMNYIGDLLSYWLAPGSPPNVAPQIDSWGMSAMGEYLKGMSSADFGVLKSIQSPLQSVLDAVMDPKAIGGAMENITRGLSDALGAINAGGAVDPKVFDDIRAAAGQYGGELAKLARDQLNLAAATQNAQKAQDALAAAQDRQKAATSKVSALTRQYNQMLRAGASKEALANKLKEINAAESERDAADKDVRAKEQALDLAKKEQQATKDQADAQAALVDQILALIKAQQEANKVEKEKPEKAGAGEGTLKLPGVSAPSGGGADIGSALEGIKQAIRDKVAAMFAPLVDAWNTAKERVVAAFGEFMTRLQPVINWFKGVWEVLKVVVQAFVDTVLPPLQQFWQDLQTAFRDKGGKLLEAFKDLWIALQPLISTVLQVLGAALLVVAGIIAGVFNGALKAAVPFIEMVIGVVTGLVKVVTGVVDVIVGLGEALIGLFTGDTARIDKGMEKFVKGLVKIVSGLVDTITEFIFGMGRTILSFIGGFVGGIYDFFKNLYNKLVGHSIIPDMVNGIIDWFAKLPGQVLKLISTMIKNILDTIKGALSDIVDAGEDIVTAIKKGITDTWDTITTWLSTALSDLGTAFTTTIATLSSIGGNIVTAISTGVSTAWSTITTNITNLLAAGISWTQSAIDKINGIGSSIVSYISSGFSNAWSNVTTAITNALAGGISWTQAAIDKIYAIGSSIVSYISSGLSAAWSSVTTAITTALAGGISWTQAAIDKIYAIGSDIVSKISSGISSAWSTITNGIQTLISGGVSWSQETLNKIYGIGSSVISNIWEGMKSAWGTYITSNLNSIVALLPDWFKRLLGIGGGSSSIVLNNMATSSASSLIPARTAAYTPAAATTNNRTLNFNIPATINNGMDQAQLGAFIRQTVADMFA